MAFALAPTASLARFTKKASAPRRAAAPRVARGGSVRVSAYTVTLKTPSGEQKIECAGELIAETEREGEGQSGSGWGGGQAIARVRAKRTKARAMRGRRGGGVVRRHPSNSCARPFSPPFGRPARAPGLPRPRPLSGPPAPLLPGRGWGARRGGRGPASAQGGKRERGPLPTGESVVVPLSRARFRRGAGPPSAPALGLGAPWGRGAGRSAPIQAGIRVAGLPRRPGARVEERRDNGSRPRPARG